MRRALNRKSRGFYAVIEGNRFLLHAQLSQHIKQVGKARSLIAAALTQCQNPYIALSGGKDSLVAADLVWDQRPETPAVYYDAVCAFPETYALLDRLEEQGRPIIRWPCEPFLETLERLGGPDAPGVENATMESTVYAPIRSLLAAYPFDGVFVGLRLEESRGRRMLTVARGQNFHNQRDGIWQCLPVAQFTYADIWAYIASNRLDYNRVYDKMEDLPERERRVSYWAGETNRHMGRWVWLKHHYPDLFNRFAERFPEVRWYS